MLVELAPSTVMFINCMSIALPVRTENRAVGKTSNPNPNPQLCGVLDVWLHLLPHGELWCFLYIDYFIYLYIFCGWRICPQLRQLSTSLSYLMTSEIVIPWTCVQMYWWDWVRPLCDYGLCLNPSCVGRLHSIWAQISYHIVHLSVRQRNSACLRAFFFPDI